jgi:hypothetical protein
MAEFLQMAMSCSCVNSAPSHSEQESPRPRSSCLRVAQRATALKATMIKPPTDQKSQVFPVAFLSNASVSALLDSSANSIGPKRTTKGVAAEIHGQGMRFFPRCGLDRSNKPHNRRDCGADKMQLADPSGGPGRERLRRAVDAGTPVDFRGLPSAPARRQLHVSETRSAVPLMVGCDSNYYVVAVSSG